MRFDLAQRPGHHHPLPPGAPFCVLVPGFLSAQECADFISAGEARGFASAASDYPPSYRNNDRLVWDRPGLAADFLERLRVHVPPTLQEGEGEEARFWTLDSINERFRFCRYAPGQAFNIHQDGVFHRRVGLRSRLTFMVYLTDGEAFTGGDTVFHEGGPGTLAPPLLARVRPRAGTLILFDHSLWHAGEEVTAGVKHILRSDVFYRCDTVPDEGGGVPFSPPHQGYVWALAAAGAGLLASGGRDRSIRLWDESGQPRGTLAGHTQSVLSLAALPDRRLASVSRDRRLMVWDLAERACMAEVVAHDAACLAVAAASDDLIATGAADGLIRLWSPRLEPLATLTGHAGWVWALAACGDGVLASASEDGQVMRWDLRSRSRLATLPGRVPLRTLDGAHGLLATGDIEGQVVVRRGQQVVEAFGAHSAAVRRVRFLDAATLATAGEDGWVRVWRWADRRLLRAFRHLNFATDVLPLSNGRLLSCSYDGEIRAHSLLDCPA